MSKAKQSTIDVQGADITVLSKEHGDYISLTDMAKKFGDDVLIYSWMRNRNTLELIGIWEQSRSITRILKVSNSRPLESRPATTASR